MKLFSISAVLAALLGVSAAHAFFDSKSTQLGSIDTAFKFLGANHKIVVEVFDDPKVQGVSCYVSRAKTGGISGSLGLAEDKAEASVACRAVGDIVIKNPLSKNEEVFSQSASIVFKKIRVVRMVDEQRKTLVYTVYSEKLIDGSPQNSITAVPVGRPIPVKQ